MEFLVFSPTSDLALGIRYTLDKESVTSVTVTSVTVTVVTVAVVTVTVLKGTVVASCQY